jgi:transcriptional regulator with XRE-family HTH domain
VPQKRVLGPRTPRLGALGRAIETKRKTAGLSQEELGERMSIYSTQISALERGRENPGYQRLVDLAEALNTSVADLATLADQLCDEG